MKAGIAGCVLNASTAAAAGFEFRYVGTGLRRTVITIDKGVQQTQPSRSQ